MKAKYLHTLFVISATILFGTFTLLHEYDWLLPPSPVETVASTTQVPLPDVIEEHGNEDEIEHDDFKEFLVSPDHNKQGSYMIDEDRFVPHVATPPPDMV